MRLELENTGMPLSVDGIETDEMVTDRTKKFINQIVTNANCNQTVLAFTHSSTIGNVMRYILSQNTILKPEQVFKLLDWIG